MIHAPVEVGKNSRSVVVKKSWKKALKNNICLPRPVRAVKDSLLGEKNGEKIGKMCDIVVSDANIISLSEVNKYHIP